jgi:hypothetical protein
MLSFGIVIACQHETWLIEWHLCHGSKPYYFGQRYDSALSFLCKYINTTGGPYVHSFQSSTELHPVIKTAEETQPKKTLTQNEPNKGATKKI